MSRKPFTRLLVITLVMTSLPGLRAGDITISRFTIDAGGGRSTGGSLDLEGTIGQSNAGPGATGMSGGSYTLTGGFWQPLAACACPGDSNLDGLRDGRDIQAFIHCAVTGTGCSCAEMDGMPGVDANDVIVFVSTLLSGNTCP